MRNVAVSYDQLHDAQLQWAPIQTQNKVIIIGTGWSINMSALPAMTKMRYALILLPFDEVARA